MVDRDAPPPLEAFESSRSCLRAAADARRSLLEAWNSLKELDVFDLSIRAEDDGRAELWAASEIPSEVEELLDQHSRVFLTSVKAAMDAAVFATAQTVCNALWPVEPDEHRIPLCENPSEFNSLVDDGLLLGLRPDQVRVLHQLQPYQSGDESREYIGRTMSHLAAALAAAKRGQRLVRAWATNFEPEFHPDDGVTVQELTLDPGGLLSPHLRLMQFRVAPPEAAHGIRVRPNVALDPILNAPPWPTNLDDNISRRTNGLLVIARRLIEGLERSVSTPTFIQHFGRIDDVAPTVAASVWEPVRFDDADWEAEVREGLKNSNLNLASYRGDEGQYTLLRLDGDTIIGRDIPEASPPELTDGLGAGVEKATLEAAAVLGLPDFVFHPKVVRKGSGRREIGDGTIITGSRGIALQVKARESATNDPSREASWLQKKAGEALRQARGTIRSTLCDPTLSLTNLRGRTLPLTGDTIDWVPLVILDHPAPPDDVTPDREPDTKGLVLLRRDWEFLWDQLRSVSAIVDYAHRVAGDERIPLGTEATRYFDLADADERAEPEPQGHWVDDIGANQTSGPTLPREPADVADVVGHGVFHRILEDIAATDFTGDEATRVEVLALIDRVAVTHRAELGRTLLRRIDHCALAPADTLRVQHRMMFVDRGRLQVAFTVYSQFTGYHKHLYETWLLHRRQRFLEATGAEGPEYPWTVGVLLTPRPDGARLWDTTVFATNSGRAYEQHEFDRLAEVLDQARGTDDAIE